MPSVRRQMSEPRTPATAPGWGRPATWAAAIGLWEAGWWIAGKVDRVVLFREARAMAAASGKPLLVVGEPDGEYPCGDVTLDLRPRSACRGYVRADLERPPLPFPDRMFGAAFASHILEHLEDPEAALRELHRVADHVVIAWPRPWRIATFLVPGHRWLVLRSTDRADGVRFVRLRRRAASHPTRYGTRFGDVVGGGRS